MGGNETRRGAAGRLPPQAGVGRVPGDAGFPVGTGACRLAEPTQAGRNAAGWQCAALWRHFLPLPRLRRPTGLRRHRSSSWPCLRPLSQTRTPGQVVPRSAALVGGPTGGRSREGKEKGRKNEEGKKLLNLTDSWARLRRLGADSSPRPSRSAHLLGSAAWCPSSPAPTR